MVLSFLFFMVAIATRSGLASASCCDAKLNLIALFDRSNSVLENNNDFTNFMNAKSFLKDVFQRIALDDEDAAVTAAYTYGTGTNLEWDFSSSTSTDLNQINTAIDGFPNPQGDSNPDIALNRARLLFNTQTRNDSCNVVLILSDGQAESKAAVQTEAEDLRSETGATVCVVEFIDPAETATQRTNRDVVLQIMKGPSGSIIGSNLFASATYSRALKNTLSCLCNTCGC